MQLRVAAARGHMLRLQAEALNFVFNPWERKPTGWPHTHQASLKHCLARKSGHTSCIPTLHILLSSLCAGQLLALQ
jgi:hypothetical protein